MLKILTIFVSVNIATYAMITRDYHKVWLIILVQILCNINLDSATCKHM